MYLDNIEQKLNDTKESGRYEFEILNISARMYITEEKPFGQVPLFLEVFCFGE